MVVDPSNVLNPSRGSAIDRALWPSFDTNHQPGHVYGNFDPQVCLYKCSVRHAWCMNLQSGIELWEMTPDHPQYGTFIPAAGGTFMVKTKVPIMTEFPDGTPMTGMFRHSL